MAKLKSPKSTAQKSVTPSSQQVPAVPPKSTKMQEHKLRQQLQIIVALHDLQQAGQRNPEYPGQIITSRKIEEWLKSPANTLFKRLLTGFLLAFLTIQQRAEMNLPVVSVGASDGRHKPRKTSHAHGGEVEKPNKADSKSIGDWFKDFFNRAYSSLIVLSQSLTDGLTTFDQNVGKLLASQLPAMVETLSNLGKNEFIQLADKHAAELQLSGMEPKERMTMIDAAASAHLHAFPTDMPMAEFDTQVMAKTLRDEFAGTDTDVTAEDVSRVLVDRHFMPRINDGSPDAVQANTPQYNLLRLTYQQKLLDDPEHHHTCEQAAQECNDLNQLCAQVRSQEAQITAEMDEQLYSSDAEVARMAQTAQVQAAHEAAPLARQRISELLTAHEGGQQKPQAQRQRQALAGTDKLTPFNPRPTPTGDGRKRKELENDRTQSQPRNSADNADPQPLTTRPKPSQAIHGKENKQPQSGDKNSSTSPTPLNIRPPQPGGSNGSVGG
jgi:hypothetical protein